MVDQVLIKWSGWPNSLATWEKLIPLQQQFPEAPAWGQAGFQDRGSPRTSSRPRKPNAHVVGPEWVQSLVQEKGAQPV
jgi:hypothetical protein